MELRKTISYWILIWVALTLFFSTSLSDIVISFFFVTFLMPIVVATSMVFNRYLVPEFLLKLKKWKFILYLSYLLVVSIYLELLVMILAFVILADYQIDNLGKIAGDIYLLTLVLYLIVLIESLVLTIRNLREKDKKISEISSALEKEQEEEIAIRVDRKNVILKLEEILFIESLADYVQIHTIKRTLITKEKISGLQNRLPQVFVRIHRSFLVNKGHIDSYKSEEVEIGGKALPIGRKFKKSTQESLEAKVIV